MTTIGILLVIILALAFSLGVFCLFVAVGTYVVKKIWFSDAGGRPRKYSYSHLSVQNRSGNNNGYREFRSSTDGKTYSATGWVWNDNTKLWEPPDYLPSEAPPIHKERTGPTYEEWKAQQENKDKSTT